ncbi:hypothetical protein KUTeg_016587 [Tegillarca granosa]|uniref:Uncharacterized protein n=1 Tax=Tegillarca granosa TaxID=220873 RepID=A0ABQ9ER34_TEGGR|nr:hypothetical protein KUTeg_016587 [Tegillarca granosa]
MAMPPCCDANHHGTNQQATYTPDKSEEELEFSDSVANPYKMNNWQRHRDQCTPWQTDTSPSDTFDNEENDENTQPKELPIDNLLNNLEKTSSEDNSENYATPDASG